MNIRNISQKEVNKKFIMMETGIREFLKFVKQI